MCLEQAVLRHQLGCWRPEPASQAESQEAQRRARGVRSNLRKGKPPEALQRPTLQPTAMHPVAEGQLVSTGWLEFAGVRGKSHVCPILASRDRLLIIPLIGQGRK